jgi:hypothetical protein
MYQCTSALSSVTRCALRKKRSLRRKGCSIVPGSSSTSKNIVCRVVFWLPISTDVEVGEGSMVVLPRAHTDEEEEGE